MNVPGFFSSSSSHIKNKNNNNNNTKTQKEKEDDEKRNRKKECILNVYRKRIKYKKGFSLFFDARKIAHLYQNIHTYTTHTTIIIIIFITMMILEKPVLQPRIIKVFCARTGKSKKKTLQLLLSDIFFFFL